jgi:hypothetical protein
MLVAYLLAAENAHGPLLTRRSEVPPPVLRSRSPVSPPHPARVACLCPPCARPTTRSHRRRGFARRRLGPRWHAAPHDCSPAPARRRAAGRQGRGGWPPPLGGAPPVRRDRRGQGGAPTRLGPDASGIPLAQRPVRPPSRGALPRRGAAPSHGGPPLPPVPMAPLHDRRMPRPAARGPPLRHRGWGAEDAAVVARPAAPAPPGLAPWRVAPGRPRHPAERRRLPWGLSPRRRHPVPAGGHQRGAGGRGARTATAWSTAGRHPRRDVLASGGGQRPGAGPATAWAAPSRASVAFGVSATKMREGEGVAPRAHTRGGRRWPNRATTCVPSVNNSTD